MTEFDRERTISAAQAILDERGWCVLEACTDVPRQVWEARLLMFDHVADVIAETVEGEVREEPWLDLRLTGCDRVTLRPDPALGTYLCYVAQTPVPAALY